MVLVPARRLLLVGLPTCSQTQVAQAAAVSGWAIVTYGALDATGIPLIILKLHNPLTFESLHWFIISNYG